MWQEAPEQRDSTNSRWRGISSADHVRWRSEDDDLSVTLHESAPAAWEYNNPAEWTTARERRRISAVKKAQRRTDFEVRRYLVCCPWVREA